MKCCAAAALSRRHFASRRAHQENALRDGASTHAPASGCGWKQIRGHEIHEHPKLGRQMPARWPEHPHDDAVLDGRAQHRDQRSVLQLPADGEVRHAGEAKSLFGETELRLQRVGDHGDRQIEIERATVAAERPSIQFPARRRAVHQADVAAEIFRLFGNAHAPEIVRRSDDGLAERSQCSRHQPGIAGAAGADDCIETFLDHIHQTVAAIDVELDIGIEPVKLGDLRHEEHAGQRQADLQFAARGAAGLRQFHLRRLDLAHDPAAALEIQRAFRRERDGAGGAVKQSHAEAFFQFGHGLADRRRGDAEPASGLGEAAGFGRLDEGIHRADMFHR